MDLLEWVRQNKEALEIIGGTGVVGTVATALLNWRAKAAKARREKRRGVDKFPFAVITKSADLLQVLMPGGENDPLAPGRIEYQRRDAAEDTSSRIAERLLRGEQRWLLLLGRTGIGKTREAAEVARHMIDHGWTVLVLTKDHELDRPAAPPEGVPTRRLLFLLDDLNRRVHGSRYYDTLQAHDPERALHSPLQERILEALKTYERFFGAGEVRVLATARSERMPESSDEPSEWDKLEFDRYRAMWDRFEPFYHLPEPDDRAVRAMLETTSRAAGIEIVNSPAIVQGNDRTFGNIVANLQRAHVNKTALTPANFQNTLHGTWKKRYEDAVKRHPLAAVVFEAIAVLRAVGAPLTADSVVGLVVRLHRGPVWTKAFLSWRARREVLRLIQDAGILHPRDGQIEASGHGRVEPRQITAVAAQMMSRSRRDPAETTLCLDRIGAAALMLGDFTLADRVYGHALEVNGEDGQAWYGRGKALAEQGDHRRAIECYRQALDRVSDFYWAWYDLGRSQYRSGDYEQAAVSLGEARRLRPSDHKASVARGDALRAAAKALRERGDEAQADELLFQAYGDYLEALALRPNRAIPAVRGRDEVAALLGENLPEPLSSISPPEPSDHTGWYRRGNIRLSESAYTDAADSYRRAIAARDGYADAWYGLGLVHFKQYEYGESIPFLPRHWNSTPTSTGRISIWGMPVGCWASTRRRFRTTSMPSGASASMPMPGTAGHCPWPSSACTRRPFRTTGRHCFWNPTSSPSTTTWAVRYASSPIWPGKTRTRRGRPTTSGRHSTPMWRRPGRASTPMLGTDRGSA